MNNRKHNATNPYQGKSKKVLCVCSAGLLRSPTIAKVLSDAPFHYNTRSCGHSVDWALIQLDDVLVHWADEVVCVDETGVEEVLKIDPDAVVKNLDISDSYEFMDSDLVWMISNNYPNLKQYAK